MAKNENGQQKSYFGDTNALLDLRVKSRPHETIIRYFLMFCGIISIFTTLGIILVLGNESIAFFTRRLWEQTNKPIVQAIDADQTVFYVETSGRHLPDEGLIRIGNEEMEIVHFDENAINIAVTGTGGGFTRFCNGETDINNASRAITESELASCRNNGIEPLEFRVGTDALAIVVNPANEFATDVTFEELQQIFAGAQTWAEVRPEWPNAPILRFIPGEDSGTFDFFTEVVFDGDGSPMFDALNVVTSEDDTQLVRTISENEFAIGFFGYAYYLENQESLRVLNIEGVTPEAATVEDGTYNLARPLYIYTGENIINEKPQVATFIEYYLIHVNELIAEVGYFPASETALNEARQTWLSITGSSADELPEIDMNAINGNIEISGSSTVFPLTRDIRVIFIEAGYLPQIQVVRGASDTEAVAHAEGATIEIGDKVTLIEFFTNTVWQPPIREFGIMPLVYGTLATSFIAMLVALPLGLGAAIYLSEYAPTNVRTVLKPILEILAGIPTVVYGYFALTFMTPLLRGALGSDVVEVYNSTSAGIVVGILILPLVSSMAEDALSAVPRSLREASYGLGATKLETTLKVVLPAALSGILAAFIVAVSRAIGETMVVAIAAGAGPQNDIPGLLASRGPGIIFQPAETMTGHMARISGGDLSYDSIDYNSIFAIGMMLFIITLILNVISRAIISRFRESY